MLVWHLRGGFVDAGFGVFRLCWGIWGSDTAKFSRFVRPFSEIRRYTQGQMSEDEVGRPQSFGCADGDRFIGSLGFSDDHRLICRR